ncbi:MAG TPA: molybdopterin-dependent oxidoreductase [Verrucomicrobiae bacterium]|nr:molybdopterin-dependent oxidoreductase [Verrucomicrobiae bacterium]
MWLQTYTFGKPPSPCAGRGPRQGPWRLSRRHLLVQGRRVLALCALTAATLTFAQTPPNGATSLLVLGNVENKLTLSVSELQRLPVQRVEDVRQLRMPGTPGNQGEQTRRYTGVLLRDVLNSAKLIEKDRHDLRRSIVVVTATDGYQAIFSWAELFLSPIGDGALIIFERDGAPLPANEGPLALVSLRDTQPGPRHVKWLARLEIRRVSE